jgi:hypothetical protein
MCATSTDFTVYLAHVLAHLKRYVFVVVANET